MSKLPFLYLFMRKVSNEVRGQLISFPTNKTEQKQIVHQLDTLSTETKNLENIYQQKLNALEELKKSILQKAFAGELTSPKRAVSDSEAATPLADINDGYSPSHKKTKTLKSPERA